MVAARRFPPPWTVEEQPACFVVRDHNGQALAYIYYEDEQGRRSAAKLLRPRDEAANCGQRAAGAIEKASNCGEAPLLMLRDDDLSGGSN